MPQAGARALLEFRRKVRRVEKSCWFHIPMKEHAGKVLYTKTFAKKNRSNIVSFSHGNFGRIFFLETQNTFFE